ncbi:hypothetical protein STZ1_50195 [Bacillus subtilis]
MFDKKVIAEEIGKVTQHLLILSI